MKFCKYYLYINDISSRAYFFLLSLWEFLYFEMSIKILRFHFSWFSCNKFRAIKENAINFTYLNFVIKKGNEYVHYRT